MMLGASAAIAAGCTARRTAQRAIGRGPARRAPRDQIGRLVAIRPAVEDAAVQLHRLHPDPERGAFVAGEVPKPPLRCVRSPCTAYAIEPVPAISTAPSPSGIAARNAIAASSSTTTCAPSKRERDHARADRSAIARRRRAPAAPTCDRSPGRSPSSAPRIAVTMTSAASSMPSVVAFAPGARVSRTRTPSFETRRSWRCRLRRRLCRSRLDSFASRSIAPPRRIVAGARCHPEPVEGRPMSPCRGPSFPRRDAGVILSRAKDDRNRRGSTALSTTPRFRRGGSQSQANHHAPSCDELRMTLRVYARAARGARRGRSRRGCGDPRLRLRWGARRGGW